MVIYHSTPMTLTTFLFSTTSQLQDILLESKQMLMKLGYPEIIASLFYEKFGKRAPLLAKWYKETNANDPADENWWRSASHGFEKINAAVLSRLYDATKQFAEGEISLEQYNEVRDRLDFASFDEKDDPKIELIRIKGYTTEEFFKELFFKRPLIRDIVSGKLVDLAPYSRLPYQKASDKYEEKFLFSDRTPIKTYENGWMWIDAGDKCDLLGKKMKNCGSVGVMGTDPNRTMISLFDSNKNPHVVVTYSPTEKRISGIEGRGGTEPKDEYLDYIIDLSRALNTPIDAYNIKSTALKLKALLSPVKFQRIQKPSTSGFAHDAYFLFQLPNGKSYYTDGRDAAPKEQVDSVTLRNPPADIYERLKSVFDYYQKDEILRANPGFTYEKIFDMASNPVNERVIKRMVKESLKSTWKSVLQQKNDKHP